jgi:hypothetical protein
MLLQLQHWKSKKKSLKEGDFKTVRWPRLAQLDRLMALLKNNSWTI